MVNMLYLEGKTERNMFVLDFTMKIYNRDRSSLYFVAYSGDKSEKMYLRQRLRNFKSACLLAMNTLEVQCLEDDFLDESLGVNQLVKYALFIIFCERVVMTNLIILD